MRCGYFCGSNSGKSFLAIITNQFFYVSKSFPDASAAVARPSRHFPRALPAWREGRGTLREHPLLGAKFAELSASTPRLARRLRNFPRAPFPCHWPLRHFPRPPFPLSASVFQGSPRIRRRGSVKSTSPTPRASRFRGPSSGRQPVAVPKHRRRPSAVYGVRHVHTVLTFSFIVPARCRRRRR